MTQIRMLLALGAVTLALTGCGAFDRLTGGVDNTVLPGQREDAIPGRSQFPDGPDPAVERAPEPLDPPPPAADDAAGCQPDDPGCAPPAGDDTFSDPQ